MTPYAFVAGRRKAVHAELSDRGFRQLSENIYEKDGRTIRWVQYADQLDGVDGRGRTFLSVYPFDIRLENRA